MRRKGFTLLEATVVLVILLILVAVLFPVFYTPKEKRRDNCMSNLKQIGIGVVQYLEDYDEKYPLANAGQQGWKDGIMPYMKSELIFQCVKDESGAVQGKSDYFYNARLAGQTTRKLTYLSSTVMNGDGIPDSPSNVSFSKYPATWATDINSPAWRHLNGANYAFADGHAKWLAPTVLANNKDSSKDFSFVLK